MRFLLLLSLLVTASLHATPDHTIDVSESLFGTNRNGYALLRTQSDNLGSYFDSETTIFLDEYSKTDGKPTPVQSTLIAQTRHSIHPDADPTDPDSMKRSISKKDDSILFSSLLTRYRTDRSKTWTNEMFSRLRTTNRGGICFDKNLNIIWGGFISEALYRDRNSDQEWVLESVSEDLNCLFLHVRTPQGADTTISKIIIVPEERTKQVRAWKNRSEVYLSLGSFPTLTEAREATRELMATALEAGTQELHPEIWSMSLPTLETIYHIVEADSKNAIRKDLIPVWREQLKVDPIPILGKKLRKVFEISEP